MWASVTLLGGLLFLSGLGYAQPTFPVGIFQNGGQADPTSTSTST